MDKRDRLDKALYYLEDAALEVETSIPSAASFLDDAIDYVRHAVEEIEEAERVQDN